MEGGGRGGGERMKGEGRGGGWKGKGEEGERRGGPDL